MTSPVLEDLDRVFFQLGKKEWITPNMSLLRVFDQKLDEATLLAEVDHFQQNKNGLGRKIVSSRIPGASPRWVPTEEVSPGQIDISLLRASKELSEGEFSDWVTEQVNVKLDPEAGIGWYASAAHLDGGRTAVFASVHHSYGDPIAVVAALLGYAANEYDFDAQASLGDEVQQVVDRVASGVKSAGKLVGQLLDEPKKAFEHPDVRTIGDVVNAFRSNLSRPDKPSGRRTLAVAEIPDVASWKSISAANGGSPTAFQTLITANLLRGIRGESDDRELRLVIPVDGRRQSAGGEAADSDSVTANASFNATIELPGGARNHDNLPEVNDAMRQAVVEAADAQKQSAGSTNPPGIIDSMNLLPRTLYNGISEAVFANADAVVANVGVVPPEIFPLQGVNPTNILVAGPLFGTDLITDLVQTGDKLALAVTADSARIPEGVNLKDVLKKELSEWGIEAHYW